ncbi:MAG: hypothetical protein ABIU05_05845 [Nitrospirales bacterium]
MAWNYKFPKVVLKYFRSIGASSLVFAVAGVVMTPFYWTAVSIGYFGLFLLAFDLWFEPFRGLKIRERRAWKAGLMLVLFAIGVFCGVGFVFRSAPLGISVVRHLGNFQDGEVIGGITWKPPYSELRVSFTNESQEVYEDFDMIIKTDLQVAKTGWIDIKPNCSFDLHQFPAIPEPRGRGKDAKGNIVEGPYKFFVDNGPYRIHCDKLLAHDHISVIFALVSGLTKNLNEVDMTKIPESLFGPKKLPDWAKIYGSYRVRMRPYSISKAEHLTGD